jgi:hypothetical protein
VRGISILLYWIVGIAGIGGYGLVLGSASYMATYTLLCVFADPHPGWSNRELFQKRYRTAAMFVLIGAGAVIASITTIVTMHM